MKKQLVSALLVGAMTATALVGCGGTSSKSSSTKTDSTKTESKKTPTAKAVNASKVSGNPRIFMPIHKGIDGFMSEEQFKKFFWPTLQSLIVALINEGLTP